MIGSTKRTTAGIPDSITLEENLSNQQPVRRPKEISRRRLLQYGATAAAAIPLSQLLAACGGGATESKEVVYVGYGGTPQTDLEEVVLKPYFDLTGTTVKTTTGAGDLAKLKAMVDSGKVTWDAISITTPNFSRAIAQGLLRPMDYSVVSREGFANPSLVNDYAVPNYAYSHAVFWNKEAFPDGLSTWADVWDVKKYPGKRGFQQNAYYLFEAAALADGIPADRLYPFDIDRILAKIDEIREHIIFPDLNTIQNLVAQGEIVTGDLNLSRVQTLISDGVPLEYTWNENIVDAVWWVMPKDSPNPKGTLDLIKYTMQPEVQLAFLERTGFTPTVQAALDTIPADKWAGLPGTPTTLKNAATLSLEYYAEFGDEAQRRLDEWLLKG
jgi:putative spermidine/putrescine transport system substrate-binding protein